MRKKKDQFSWKQTWQINKRVFKMCTKAKPGFFAVRFATQILWAISPYVTLYCSARFLNELTAARRPEVLAWWVLLILGLTAALGVIGSLLRRLEEAGDGMRSFWLNWIYGQKALDMDFSKADDTRYSDRLVQILQTSNFSGHGIPNFTSLLPRLAGAFFKVAGGVALSVSLFVLPVKPQAQNLPLLKAGLVLAVGGILAVLVISPLLADKSIRAWNAAAEAGRSGNRFFNFYGNLLYTEEKRALDVRMYRQDLYGQEVDAANNSWTGDGVFVKLNRGILGIINGITEMLSQMMMGLVYLYVCLKAWYGAFGVGSVTQYVGALSSLAGGFSELMSIGAEIRGNTAFLKQVLDYLDIPNEM